MEFAIHFVIEAIVGFQFIFIFETYSLSFFGFYSYLNALVDDFKKTFDNLMPFDWNAAGFSLHGSEPSQNNDVIVTKTLIELVHLHTKILR